MLLLAVSERTYASDLRVQHFGMVHRVPEKDHTMSATIIECQDFQRQTRTDHLVRFMMVVIGLCVAAAGIASTIVSLAQM